MRIISSAAAINTTPVKLKSARRVCAVENECSTDDIPRLRIYSFVSLTSTRRIE
jgi:hypothetical protein